MSQRKENGYIRCPLEYGLKIFGSRWNARIICVLSAKEILRFSELRREIGNFYKEAYCQRCDYRQ